MAYRLRPARKSDEPLIWKATMETVWNDVPDDERPTLDRRDFEGRLMEYIREFVEGRRGERFIAEDDAGRLAGYMILGEITPIFSPHPVGFVYDIWVAPDRRRSGLGRFLVEEAERWAHAKGYAKIKLEVGSANAPAQALYRGAGFRPERLYMAKTLR
jgi:ribosomal protein S18 acetylase RimI-like enzyme